jgi:hypothetical protein
MELLRQQYKRHGITYGLIGAIAGLVFPNDVRKFAIQSGLYIIVPNGDTVKIDVPDNFKPRMF